MSETVTKNELIQVVMENSQLSRLEAYRFVEDFFEIMTKSLEDGGEVKVSGFGNFVLRDKAARVGRNPKTKEEFPIEARRVVSFHTSNLLKDLIKDYKVE
ncbi:MAG: integration host factor subunit alpha [Neisseriaceae bacterium]|jgi:integration host factor subunit alpha|nr:MAG: integration host factor subunit alpha [Neisseriaceae bacterium]